MVNQDNFILQTLNECERGALAPHLTRVQLQQQQILYDVRDEIDRVYFPNDAVVSLTIPLSTGETIETAMVGRDGVIGTSAALNGKLSLNRAVVQIGGTCLACAVEPLKSSMKQHDHLRTLIGGHEQALFAQRNSRRPAMRLT